MFLAFEGIDGCGKSTQIGLLVDYLEQELGRDVVVLKEPGSTPLGESIRSLLLEPGHGDLEPETELFLFMAARSHLVRQVIAPALESGAVVLCDRFLWSSVVYQGMAGGLGVETVLKIGRLATGGILPDRTFLLDIPVSVSYARKVEQGKVQEGAVNRMEEKGRRFQEKVRRGFLVLARRFPRQFALIDARGAPADVQGQVRRRLPRRLRLSRAGK
ncbi:MAG: dTMP kinase [Planctomycetes bacterium]|nr:dTMP kinase [Planctomycetota bacterium]